MMQHTSEPLARPQRLGRPRLAPDKLRTEELRLYLTLTEKQRLDDDAQSAGVRPAEYLRRLITGRRPAAIDRSPVGNPRLLLELNAIGNNLNQAVRGLHGYSTPATDWDHLRQLLQAALERVAFGDVR